MFNTYLPDRRIVYISIGARARGREIPAGEPQPQRQDTAHSHRKPVFPSRIVWTDGNPEKPHTIPKTAFFRHPSGRGGISTA